MALTKEQKQTIIKDHGTNEKDTGSTEVQIALLTARIADLTEHFKVQKKDHNSRRGLLKLVGKRRRLLKYLKRTELDKYRVLIKTLKIRR